MRFEAQRDTLSEALATAQRGVASRTGALPVLSGVRLASSGDALELVGSDLELTIRVTTPARIDAPGSTVLPARLFAEIVRELDGETVNVEVTDDSATIRGGQASITLRTLPTADFPRLTNLEGAGVQVEAEAFSDALRQVVGSASRDDARPILTGVLLTALRGGLRLVATDSYRLAVRDLSGVSVLDEGQSVLVAAKGLTEVERLLGGDSADAEIVLGEREVLFRIGTSEVTTRLIEGEFPNYQQLIPSGYPNRLTINRETLAHAVKRVRLVGQGRDTAPVRLAMSSSGVELSAVAQDIGEAHEAVDGKFEGGELTVAFNSQFLLDGLDVLGSQDITIESVDPLKPAVMRNTDSTDFLYLLMPVRIS